MPWVFTPSPLANHPLYPPPRKQNCKSVARHQSQGGQLLWPRVPESPVPVPESPAKLADRVQPQIGVDSPRGAADIKVHVQAERVQDEAAEP